MKETKVDDMLIEMISPKLAEIEEKFAQGKGLQQEDINTLLLKSQYNHINHLDLKLNEIASSNAQLRLDFSQLETKVEQRIGALETKVEQRIGALEIKFSQLETKLEQLRTDLQKTINSTIKWYVGGAGIIMFLLKSLDMLLK